MVDSVLCSANALAALVPTAGFCQEFHVLSPITNKNYLTDKRPN